MRRNKLLVVLLIALAAGVTAAYLSMDYLQQQATPLIAATPQVKMVVATRPLAVGHVLTAEDVKTIEWPGSAVPEGFFSTPEEVIGRGVITRVAMNEPILAGKIAEKEAGGGLPIVIPEGMRAVSVRVDEVIAVAGFVLPGTRVDVIVTLPQNETRTTQFVQRLQNVTVLAAGQTIERTPDGQPQTVSVMTFLVTPEQAELLIMASREGQIQLALRNTLDMEEIRTTGVRGTGILAGGGGGGGARRGGGAAPRPTAEAEPSGGMIEVYKGGTRTLIRR